MQASLLTFLHEIVRPLHEFIFPPSCLSCEQYMDENGIGICGTCLQSIRHIDKDDPLYEEMSARLTSSGYIDGLVSAFHFEKDGTLQSLIHQLKYNELTRAGVELGRILGRVMVGRNDVVSSAGIVPVPLHPAKRRERGYNQSVYIAKGISKMTGSRIHPKLLRRKKNTRTQTTLNIEQRRENVRSAFAINSRHTAIVSGASFVLVDDVITTGATVQECARILKEEGARSVYAASIALADHGTLKDTI